MIYVRDFDAVQKTSQLRFEVLNLIIHFYSLFKQSLTLRDICITLVIEQKRASSSKQLFHSHYSKPGPAHSEPSPLAFSISARLGLNPNVDPIITRDVNDILILNKLCPDIETRWTVEDLGCYACIPDRQSLLHRESKVAR